jgi:hypothetical protein
MKNQLLTSIGILFAAIAVAQSQGPADGKSFANTSIAGSNKQWNVNDNLSASDNQYTDFGNLTSNGSYTDYLVVSDFGFLVPAGATVTGIVAEVERSDPNGKTADYSVRIVKAGVIGTTERSTGTAYPTTDAYKAYGSSTDLWGQSWSYTDINNTGFGIAIAAQRNASGSTTAGRVDHIRVTVYYQNLFTLPVRLTSFTSSSRNHSVLLKWTTADESNMDKYEVERSADGSAFSVIGTVYSQNTASVNTYSFEDHTPLKDMNYYRLKMIGLNPNDQKLSAVSMLRFSETNNPVIYPTILSAGQTFHFDNPARELLNIDFYNSTGQKVASINGNAEQFSASKLTGQQGILAYTVSDDKKQVRARGSVVIQ